MKEENRFFEVENPFFTETYFLASFQRGNKEKIPHKVQALKPETLADAPELANRAQDSLHRRHKAFLKPHNTTAKPITQTGGEKGRSNTQQGDSYSGGTKKNLMDHRRALGLCFKFGEKSFPGHQCANKGVHMLNEVPDEENQASQ